MTISTHHPQKKLSKLCEPHVLFVSGTREEVNQFKRKFCMKCGNTHFCRRTKIVEGFAPERRRAKDSVKT